MAPKSIRPKKEVKKIIYVGYPGDQASPYDFQKIKFEPRTVQPVSDEVFEMVRHIRGFHEVTSVKNAVVSIVSGQFMNTGVSKV